MTDPCAVLRCHEPRQHGTLACEAHWGLLSNKLKTNFSFALGRMLKNLGTPREAASTADFKAIRATCREAILEAIEERRQVG